ncbi:MAG TPA: ABC transporter substrate-binding protein [Methanotrichaceae archaeon]|nr:ABC transporter substrate-binding protein [Methanotrichaceae archaeon]
MLCRYALAMLELFLVLTASCLAVPAYEGPNSSYVADVEILYSKGVSLMPMLLATDQIDGYIAWQPYVSLAEECGAGKVISLTRDLPPAGSWIDHPCCVFTSSSDLILSHRDIVSAMCALNIYSNQYIRDHPSESSEIEARWLMGDADFTFGDISVSSRNLINRSSPTLIFSVDPSDEWRASAYKFIDLQDYSMASEHTGDGFGKNKSEFFDFRPHEEAKVMVSRGELVTPMPSERDLGIGCLMGDQHHTPLFIALKKWQYFNDTYGIALKPDSEGASRPSAADLIVNGKKVARFSLISAPAGAQLMTLMEQGCIDMAYVGIAPAIGAVRLGADIKVIQPVQNEGSGLVVSNGSPARNWSEFVSWAKERYSNGRPLRIADPQVGSIQDLLMRYALSEEKIRAVPAPEP